MKIAIVTGASSGLGKEFVRQLSYCYPSLNEIWVIARREEPLRELDRELNQKLRILPWDLNCQDNLDCLNNLLKSEKPFIKVLVNAAGFGKIGRVSELTHRELSEMIDLNCNALTKFTYLCLPYCGKASRVVQLASAAAFVPQPGFAVYAASKSYVLSFSRALRREVWTRGITVTAVCPGPVDTEFFLRAGTNGNLSPIKKFCMENPEQVVRQAICHAAKGKELSIYGWKIKGVFLLCKIIPHKMILFFMK